MTVGAKYLFIVLLFGKKIEWERRERERKKGREEVRREGAGKRK